MTTVEDPLKISESEDDQNIESSLPAAVDEDSPPKDDPHSLANDCDDGATPANGRFVNVDKSITAGHLQSRSLPDPDLHLKLGRKASIVTCPHCHKLVRTSTQGAVDWFTWVMVVALIFVFWPLCWLPILVSGCQAVEHDCPECHQRIGVTPAC